MDKEMLEILRTITREEINQALDSKLEPIKEDLAEVKRRVTKIEIVQENVTNKNIQLLFEGQKDTLDKFKQLDIQSDKVEDIQTTVEVLKVLTVKNSSILPGTTCRNTGRAFSFPPIY